MSMILKALEKVRKERERQLKREERRHSSVDISHKVSRSSGEDSIAGAGTSAGQKQLFKRLLFFSTLLVVLGVVALGVALYFFLRLEQIMKTVPREKPPPAVAQTVGASLLEKSMPGVSSPKFFTKAEVKESSKDTGLKKTTEFASLPPLHKSQTEPADVLPEKSAANRLMVSEERREIKEEEEAPGVALPEVKRAVQTEKEGLLPVEAKEQIKDISAEKLGLKIEGVFYDKKKPMAIINGEIVSEGDQIRGVEIIKIFKNSLRAEKGSLQYNVLF